MFQDGNSYCHGVSEKLTGIDRMERPPYVTRKNAGNAMRAQIQVSLSHSLRNTLHAIDHVLNSCIH